MHTQQNTENLAEKNCTHYTGFYNNQNQIFSTNGAGMEIEIPNCATTKSVREEEFFAPTRIRRALKL